MSGFSVLRPSVRKLFTVSSSFPEPLGRFQPNLVNAPLDKDSNTPYFRENTIEKIPTTYEKSRTTAQISSKLSTERSLVQAGGGGCVYDFPFTINEIHVRRSHPRSSDCENAASG